MFTREELWEIRDRADEAAHTPGQTDLWKRALLALADAADRLDAMIVRPEITHMPTRVNLDRYAETILMLAEIATVENLKEIREHLLELRTSGEKV